MKRIPRRTAATVAGVAAVGLILAGCSDDTTAEDTVGEATGAVESAVESIASEVQGNETELPADQVGVVPGVDGEPVELSGPILAKYNEVGGADGPLGPATGNQEEIDDGYVAEFEGGAIAWSPDTDAHVVWGQIRVAWEAAGGAGGDLGYPASDEHPIDGGLQSDFQFGHITYIDGTTEVVMG